MTTQFVPSAAPVDLLVVEDNPADSKLLIAFLRDADGPLTVKLVTDGEEAIRYLTCKGEYSNANRPDFVLLDINLPKKNGFEVLAEIRQDARVADIPVFVVSSTQNPEDLRRGQALNVAGFYPKPTDLKDFEKLADTLANQEFPRYLPGKFRVVRTEGGASTPQETQQADGSTTPGKPAQRRDELFRQLVDAVKDYAIFMLDPRGHILSWNQGAERLKGYRASESIGKHFSIFYPGEALAKNHPAYELEVAARTGRFEEEGWRLKKDGSRFWAHVTITTIRSSSGELLGFGKVTRDFTERREAEKNLRESERRFRVLVEGVRDYAIFMLTPDGIIASWNIGAERINGYQASEVIGQHFSLFYTKESQDKKHPEYELTVARETGKYEEEGLRVRKDGSTFWASVVITALRNEEGALQGFAKITRDITDRKRAEFEKAQFALELEKKVEERTSELDVSRKELEQQRDQLVRSNTDLQQFAYVASHDLQEPLRGIIACHQMLERRFSTQLTPEMNEYMSLAIESSLRMKGLIEGLLEYARVGYSPRYEAAVDFNVLVGQAIATLRPVAQQTQAVIEVGHLPTLHADPSQLSRVFVNLLSNAIKYRNGKVPKIVIGATKEETRWVFSVKDNGIGIEPQYFERVFLIFQRLHSDREKYSGTGIGLAICKRIIESHNGKIWIASEPGNGSTFYFSLPI